MFTFAIVTSFDYDLQLLKALLKSFLVTGARLGPSYKSHKKQGLVANFAIISKNLFLDNLFFNILKIPFPYMKFVIKN